MGHEHTLSRTERLIGSEALARLRSKKVAVLGIGGVGSHSAEALARCGIGHLLLVDDDIVCITNINRQIHATQKTVGRNKVDVMKDRIHDIDNRIAVDARCFRVTRDNVPDVLDNSIDYLIDALDTISAKIAIAEYCFHHHIPIISCMGTGNKLDPTQFIVTDLFKTKTCPLAKVMRHELRKRNVTALRVVCSEENPIRPLEGDGTADPCDGTGRDDVGPVHPAKAHPPASISFVPPVAGFILAGEVIKDLAGCRSR